MKKFMTAVLSASLLVPGLALGSMEGDKQQILMILAANHGKTGETAHENKIQSCQFTIKQIAGGAKFKITTESGDSLEMTMMEKDLAAGYSSSLSEDGYGKLVFTSADEKYSNQINVAIDEKSSDIALVVGVKEDGLFGHLIKDTRYKTKRIECQISN